MKQDHRVRITKTLLHESFLDLLQEKPLGKITVKELCERAGVNRATFYAHYADIFALSDEIETEFAATIMHSLSTTLYDNSLRAFSNEICKIIAENGKLCRTLFGEHSDPELPLRIIGTLREGSIQAWRTMRPYLTDDQLDRLYTFMANGSLAVIRSWVQAGMKEDSENIALFIEKMADAAIERL